MYAKWKSVAVKSSRGNKNVVLGDNIESGGSNVVVYLSP